MTDPLDDLRRLGMMTAEVEAYREWNLHDYLHGHDDKDREWVPRDVADAALTSLAAALVEMKGERERLLERIAQCHTYPLTVVAADAETGVVGLHVIDGMDASEVLAVCHDGEMPPVYEGYRDHEKETP